MNKIAEKSDTPFPVIDMKKRFTRIKWNEKVVALEWTTQDGTETHSHELTCKDAPRPAFDVALQALLPDVLAIAELGATYAVKKRAKGELEDPAPTMRVQSVSLSLAEKSGARGAVVTAMKTLEIANAPLALHTPHLLADGQGDGEPAGGDAEDGARTGVMPEGMWARIEALEQEAWAYLAGQRAPAAQLELGTAPAKEERELAGV